MNGLPVSAQDRTLHELLARSKQVPMRAEPEAKSESVTSYGAPDIEIHAPEPRATDLMQALKDSVEMTRQGKSREQGTQRDTELEGLEKEVVELQRRLQTIRESIEEERRGGASSS